MKNKQQPKKNNNKLNKKKLAITISAVMLILIVIFSTIILSLNKEKSKENMAYTELLSNIENDNVDKIEMTVGSTTLKVTLKNREKEEDTEKVIIPSTQAFIEFIQNKLSEGKTINLEQNQANILSIIASKAWSIIPTILMVALFVMIIQMQGFGNKGIIYDGEENKPDVRFNDVAGLEEEKNELVEVVDFLKNPKKFKEMGAKIPRGILLCGKPGTGKTLLAKAVAGEAGVPFIAMSGSEFIEMFAGLGASRVRKLFEKAKNMSPCIIFIDEIDAIGARRTGGSGAESENNQTLNQLLVEMDGFQTDNAVIVLAATNRPEMLDKALLRPGRFDRQITVAPPDIRGREEILKIHAKDKKFAEGVDLKDIADDTAGFTGAELSNILNEAAIIATVKNHEAINQEDLEEAIKKVTVGLQKTSRLISDKDKKLTAYHEAGHAIVGWFLPTVTKVKEISIIPRGVAGGYTMYKSDEDKYYMSKTEMEEKMISLLGGRAAERIVLNDISTGASNDIEIATKIARNMITVYGMSDNLGPISLVVDSPEELRLFGHNIEDEIGKEIKELLDKAYTNAQKILMENMDKLHRVAQVLLEKETITEKEFEEIFNEI